MADQVAHLLIDNDAYDLVDYGSVTDVIYDSTNKKLTQTAGGVTSDIVTVATLKTAMSLKKADVGLGNVDNKSSATIRGEITSANVTNALGYTPYNSTNPNGYTSNIGTVTGVKINGTTKSPTSGIVDIGTVITDVSTLAPKASPAFTGTPTAPTAASGTNTTQIATTAFVMDAFRANDAMVFKGTIGSSGATVTALPDTHYDGWTYRVITAGTYAGKVCEIGDMIICVNDGTTASNDDWTVVQTNIDGAVIGPASSTKNRIALFNGTTGKLLKQSSYTAGAAAAKGVDTSFSNTTSTNLPTTAAVATELAKKADLDSPTFTGIPKSVTPSSSSDATMIATKGYVDTVMDQKVDGPSSATNNHVAVFSGATGKVVMDSGFTIGTSVPADAVFTDTKVTSAANHYAPSTASSSDVSASASGATAAWSIDVVKGVTLNTDGKGHVTGMSVTSGKIPANPNTDTKVTSSANHYAPATASGSDVSASATGATAAWSIDVVKGVTLNTDGKGHVTGMSVTSGKVPANPNRYRPIQVGGTQILSNTSSTALNLIQGNNVQISNSSGSVTISATDTTYEAKEAASGGADVSLVTTGEKYEWNGKVSCTAENVKSALGTGTGTTKYLREDGTWEVPAGTGIGTVTSVATGTGLTGGPITSSGTISLATSGASAGSYGPSADVTGSDGATMSVPYITVDTYGRVTAIANKTYTSKNTTYSAATQSANGLMSSTDKKKLDGIAEGATANVGTITGITMNGTSKGTSGVVNLGTVITDVSGKADKSATVSTVSYDSTNKKITKTINGSTTDVVTVATLKTAMSLAKGDVGLGNVDNKSSDTIRSEITKTNVTNALGFTPPTTGAFTWGDLYTATST